jgi:two-component system response regulator CpxR
VSQIVPYEVTFTLAAAKAFGALAAPLRQEIEARCVELARTAPVAAANALRVMNVGGTTVRYLTDPSSRTLCVRALERQEVARRGPRVLIIEDDPDLRWSLADQVEAAGLTVETANDGLEAISKLQRGFIADAILLDLVMPVMNGIEFLQYREAEPALARIPAVVVTANPDMAKGLRVHEVLRKPLDPRRLQAVMRELTDRLAG